MLLNFKLRKRYIFHKLLSGGAGLAQCSGLRTKVSLVRDLAGSPFVVALSKSHLLPA